MSTPTLPCPTCSGDGTDTHQDRHTGTNKDTCRTCGGEGVIAPRTGETPESSFRPTTTSGGGTEAEYVTVPREPNEAMLKAAYDAYAAHEWEAGRAKRGPECESLPIAYRAMLAAAPPPTDRHGVAGGDAGLRDREITLEAVSRAMDEDGGWWKPCSGCHETNEGQETGNYPYSEIFRCHLGSGCRECGGIGVIWEYYSEDEFAALADESTLTPPVPPAEDDTERCIACGKPFMAGDMVLDDASGGTVHVSCCGPEPESYTGRDGEPLKPGEPIPTGYPWQPSPRVSGDREAAIAQGYNEGYARGVAYARASAAIPVAALAPVILPAFQDRLWFPEAFCDEMMPAGKKNPEDWLQVEGHAYSIGTGDPDDAELYAPFPVSNREVVAMTYQENFQQVAMTFAEDGTAVFPEGEPTGNAFWLYTEDETGSDNLREMIEQVRENHLDEGPNFIICSVTWNSEDCYFQVLNDYISAPKLVRVAIIPLEA